MLLRLVAWILAGASAVAMLPACGNTASAVATTPKYEPGSAKCGTAMNDWRPLLVEWAAADRAALEARIGQGLIAARVDGCDIQILPSCKGPSKYSYTPTTLKRDAVKIRNADELRAALPVGAARLGASLERSGELSVKLAVVGIYAAENASTKAEDMKGACDSATHVVTEFAAGAFEFFAGADAAVGASASVGGVGADGKSSSKHEVLNKDGDEASCAAGRKSDTSPPEGCGAVLRVALAPIACFEGMHHVPGKGCRKSPTADPSAARHYLTDGVVERLGLLELQLKDIPSGAPVWAKRVDELTREWSRAAMKAKIESLSLQKEILEHGGQATPDEKALLDRFQALEANAASAKARYTQQLSE